MHVENYKENVKNPCFSVEKEGKLRGECVKPLWKSKMPDEINPHGAGSEAVCKA